MSEGPIVDTLKGTASFTRKVQVREYESAEAFMSVQFEIPRLDEGADEATAKAWSAELTANAKTAFFAAKALVFEELGLEFSVSEDGVVRELLKSTLGNVTEVSPAPMSAAPSAAAVAAAADGISIPSSPPHEVKDANGRFIKLSKDASRENNDWGKARFAAFPNEFFDNRDKKADGSFSQNSPDLKHKDSQAGVWF